MPIYADHAATTKLDPAALKAMLPFLTDVYANASQPYSFAREARRALREARAEIATLIGALPEEILFTSGGTEANNWAIKGISALKPVCVSAIEHHSVLRAAKAVADTGTPLFLLPVTEDGTVTPGIFKNALSVSPHLVSVMYANNEIGTVQPIGALCDMAHKAGALFHTDAVQAVGHLPIDVHALGVDMLSASAHKFGGPKGIGFLYRKKGTPLSPLLNGGEQEYGMRAGTENIAAIVGMAKALRIAYEEMQATVAHLEMLETLLLSHLNNANVSYLRLGGVRHLPGLISLSFAGQSGDELVYRLDQRGIVASAGAACDLTRGEPSHVLTAIGLDEAYARGTIRISLGKENTGEDVRCIAAALKDCLS